MRFSRKMCKKPTMLQSLLAVVSEDTLFPTMFIHDGFITSHSARNSGRSRVKMLCSLLLRTRVIISYPKTRYLGFDCLSYFFSEGQLTLEKAKEGVLDKMTEVFKAFEALTGNYINISKHSTSDGGAKTVFLTMGSMCGNILTWLQKSGQKMLD